MVSLTRRQAILSALFGTGAIGLRAFATGIPASILLNPKSALAATDPTSAPTCVAGKATYLILSTSGNGDPLNGNVPGTYDDPGIVHSAAASMASTPIVQSGVTRKGAQAWSTLPQNILDQTSFFHHATYTVVHGNEQETLSLNGAVANNDMLVSTLASQLAGCLGTVQVQPVCIGASNGGEALIYQGRTQPILSPASLASVLTLPNGPLANLRTLRDQTVDALNAWYRSTGNPGQQNFIDKYVTSQTQLRSVSDTLLSELANVNDDSVASQITASLALIRMNIAPVMSIHIPFGGDNHSDGGLNGEATQQAAGVASIASLFSQVQSAGLAGKVSFMNLNVFGRTMAVSHEGTNGRDHNANHHCTVIIGPNIKGGVVGGATPMQGDYGATNINSTTGAGSSSGDIVFAQTFAAMGKTVGRAVGVTDDYLNTAITGGKAVEGALNGV